MRYMNAALGHLRANGAVVRPEDVARLSPLRSKQFNGKFCILAERSEEGVVAVRFGFRQRP
jgi:hypothetical protein